MLGTR
jgi:AcrR family transcriptional regulator